VRVWREREIEMRSHAAGVSDLGYTENFNLIVRGMK